MNNFQNIPNIGKVLAYKLENVGYHTLEDLLSEGSKKVFLRLYTLDSTICINHLFAIEGAILGIRWHDISKIRKNELREFYFSVKL